MPSPSNNPIPVALESLLTDIFRQYEATEEQAKAWLAVSSQLKAGNPELFAPRVTGLECALLEVKRLQTCERELAELSLAKGKADAAPTQQPAAVPAEQAAKRSIENYTIPGDGFFGGVTMKIDHSLPPDTIEMRGANRVQMNLRTGEITEVPTQPPAGELPVLPKLGEHGWHSKSGLEAKGRQEHYSADQMREYGRLCLAQRVVSETVPVLADGWKSLVSDWECGFIDADKCIREIEKLLDATPPAAPVAWDADATERLRSIVTLLGLTDSVPDGDLTGHEFAVLGFVRREIEKLKAAAIAASAKEAK